MKMEALDLACFLSKEIVEELNGTRAFINKVEAIKDKMELYIHISTSKLLDSFLQDKICRDFQKRFQSFKVRTKISYDIDGTLEEKLRFYEDRILEIIKSDIQSSSSWINDLKWELSNDSLIIFPPNKVAFHLMEENGLLDKIKNKILDELRVDLKVILSDKELQFEEDFLLQKELEEKEIATNTLNNTSNNNGSNKPIKTDKNYIYGRHIKDDPIKIRDINIETGSCTILGEIFQLETMELKNNRILVTFYITDLTDSMTVKAFLPQDRAIEFLENVSNNSYVKVSGDIVYDNYSKALVLMLKSLNKLEKEIRTDEEEEKRIELHLHTQMSTLDGINSIKELDTRAKEWGHKAIAVTDHGVVQSFPEAMEVSKKLGIKIIYGMEGYLVNDKKEIVSNFDENKEYSTFVVFDIETTGLSAVNDMITEIGAIKVENGKIIDTFSQLINPERPIPEKITNLTGITDDMVKDKPTIGEIINDFKEFIKDHVLVAHNASFDVGFIREKFKLFN